MSIRLPEEVAFTESGQVTCTQILYLEQDPICTIVGDNEINVKIQAQRNDFIGPLTMEFTIDSLRNPYSTKPTDSFSFHLTSKRGLDVFDIVQQTKDVTASVTRGAPFKSVNIDR